MEPGGPERCSLGMLIMCDKICSPKTLNTFLQTLDEKIYFRYLEEQTKCGANDGAITRSF